MLMRVELNHLTSTGKKEASWMHKKQKEMHDLFSPTQSH